MSAEPAAELLPRRAEALLREALADTPVVVLNGPRQAGKSTLARQLVEDHAQAAYVTLDDQVVRAAADADPVGFLRSYADLLVIDEIQRVPQLTLAIKADVDRDRRPGRFLLTGSTRYLTVPRLADSLAGRIDITDLWALSQGEIDGTTERFVEQAFADPQSLLRSPVSGLTKAEYLQRACAGGFPEARVWVGRRRERWFANYVRTVTEVDVRDLADIDRLAQLPDVIRLLGARTAGLANKAALAGDVGLPQTTLSRYLSLLEAVFLISPLPAWSGNRSKRVVRSPKLHITDTGLAAHLMGVDADGLAAPGAPAGAILESFVAGELRKQVSWSTRDVRMFHYRHYEGHEVDVVLERSDGTVCGVEVKAAATIRDRDVAGLRQLREAVGERFRCGVVLYTGDQSVPFGDDLLVAPISTLWLAGS